MNFTTTERGNYFANKVFFFSGDGLRFLTGVRPLGTGCGDRGPAAEEAPAAGTVNSVMENIVDYKVKVGFGGRVKAVLSFASESPSLLGAEVRVRTPGL